MQLPPAPPCLSVTHFRTADADFERRATDALAALAGCSGYRHGSLARNTDDETAWVLITEWDNVGSYRRALGNYDVKIRATTVLAEALDVPSAFESLVETAPGGDTVTHVSDKEA